MALTGVVDACPARSGLLAKTGTGFWQKVSAFEPAAGVPESSHFRQASGISGALSPHLIRRPGSYSA